MNPCLHQWVPELRELALALEERFAVASAMGAVSRLAESVEPILFSAPSLGTIDRISACVKSLAAAYLDLDPAGITAPAAMERFGDGTRDGEFSNHYIHGPFRFADSFLGACAQKAFSGRETGGLEARPHLGGLGEGAGNLTVFRDFIDAAQTWIRRFRYMDASPFSRYLRRITGSWIEPVFDTGGYVETIEEPEGGFCGSAATGLPASKTNWVAVSEDDDTANGDGDVVEHAVSENYSRCMSGTWYCGLRVANPTEIQAICLLVPFVGTRPFRTIQAIVPIGASIYDDANEHWRIYDHRKTVERLSWFANALRTTELTTIEHGLKTVAKTFYSPDAALSFGQTSYATDTSMDAHESANGCATLDVTRVEEGFDPYGSGLELGVAESIEIIPARTERSIADPGGVLGDGVSSIPTPEYWPPSPSPSSIIADTPALAPANRRASCSTTSWFRVAPVLDFGPFFHHLPPSTT